MKFRSTRDRKSKFELFWAQAVMVARVLKTALVKCVVKCNAFVRLFVRLSVTLWARSSN